jgi:hypothetical protein
MRIDQGYIPFPTFIFFAALLLPSQGLQDTLIEKVVVHAHRDMQESRPMVLLMSSGLRY